MTSARSAEFLDLRRTIRYSLSTGGEPVILHRRRRKITRSKLAVLCDVSGSMDEYTRSILQFVYAVQREIPSVETFVFSTRLYRITRIFRRYPVGMALQRLVQVAPGWAGGTDIGRSIQQFNAWLATIAGRQRTTVVIFSDGWDRGDPIHLEREIRDLKRNSQAIIWLNPLAATPGY